MAMQDNMGISTADESAAEIETLIRAQYPIIAIESWEEDRVTDTLRALSRKVQKRLLGWTSVKGIVPMDTTAHSRPIDSSSADPQKALCSALSFVDPAIFVFFDFHHYLKDPLIIRLLRDIAKDFKQSSKTLVLLSPDVPVPIELEKEITIVYFKLPGPQDLRLLLDNVETELEKRRDVSLNLTDDAREKLIQATLGLTLAEAENVIAKAVVKYQGLNSEAISLIISEKEQIIRRSGVLEFYSSSERFDHVGGMEFLKDWLRKRAKSFSKKARDFGLPAPKGILLIGVQGCGKSLTAKAVANSWAMPLLRLDAGRLFSSLVGSSEENLRRAITTAESVSPAILWVDEIEKGFAGVESSGRSDAGTSARVFGHLITWLQEKTAPVFLIATANDISRLPPEMLRKGRFDEIFFIDLPSRIERQQIFDIHLKRRGYDPEKFDLDQLVAASNEFSGAEIESAIIAALFDVFDVEQDLTTFAIISSLENTIPLSRLASEKILQLRDWAANRIRRASIPDEFTIEEGS